MNLIDQDMRILSEKSASLPLWNPERCLNSYYRNRDSVRYFPFEVWTYDMKSASEWRIALERMWITQNAEYMKSLSPCCVVSIFRYLNHHFFEEEKREVSPFLYEF